MYTYMIVYLPCVHMDAHIQFRARDFTPRTPESYDYQCGLIEEGPLHDEDSTTYGINYRSVLNELDNFHAASQLPQDVMHVLLEGLIPYEISLMLYNFVTDERYLSSDQLNDRIDCFPYSSQESKDKPTPIKPQVFTSVKATVTQSCKFMLYYTYT